MVKPCFYIIIRGECVEVDIAKKSMFKFNYQIKDFVNSNLIKQFASRQIILEDTPRTREALGFPNSKYTQRKNIKKKYDVMIECGSFKQKGQFLLQGIPTKKGCVQYVGQFIGGNANWVDKSKGIKLCDLDLGCFEWNRTNVEAIMIDSEPYNGEDKIWFSLKRYGAYPFDAPDTNAFVPFIRLKPDVYAKAIIDAISEKIGIPIVSEYFESEKFRRKIHPFVGNNGIIPLCRGFDEYIPGTVLVSTDQTFVNGPATPILFADEVTPPAEDPNNNFAHTATVTTFTAPITGTYRAVVDLDTSPSPTLVNMNYIITITGVNAGTFTFQRMSNVSFTQEFPLTVGDTVTIDVFVPNLSSVTVLIGSSWKMELTQKAIEGSTIDIGRMLPCETLLSYLKDLTIEGNLVWDYNEKKNVIIVEPEFEACIEGVGKIPDDFRYEGNHFPSNSVFGNSGFSNDGTHFYASRPQNDTIEKYLISSGAFISSFPVGTQDTAMRGVEINGVDLWGIGDATDSVYLYDLTGTYSGTTHNIPALIGSGSLSIRDLCFGDDHFWVLTGGGGSFGDRVFKFTSAWVYTTINFSVGGGGGDSTPEGITYDGEYLRVSGRTNNTIIKWSTSGIRQPISTDINILPEAGLSVLGVDFVASTCSLWVTTPTGQSPIAADSFIEYKQQEGLVEFKTSQYYLNKREDWSDCEECSDEDKDFKLNIKREQVYRWKKDSNDKFVGDQFLFESLQDLGDEFQDGQNVLTMKLFAPTINGEEREVLVDVGNFLDIPFLLADELYEEFNSALNIDGNRETYGFAMRQLEKVGFVNSGEGIKSWYWYESTNIVDGYPYAKQYIPLFNVFYAKHNSYLRYGSEEVKNLIIDQNKLITLNFRIRKCIGGCTYIVTKLSNVNPCGKDISKAFLIRVDG